MKLIRRNSLILILVLIAGVWIGTKFGGKFTQYYSNITSYFKGSEKTKNTNQENTISKESTKNPYPSGFPTNGLKEKKLSIRNDGKEEILLTSLDGGRAYAVLVDPKDTSKKLSGVFDFPTKGFSDEYTFKPEEAPEVFQATDLNRDGTKELVFDLKDYGAYTSSYGIVSVAAGKMDWVMLQEKDGGTRPAIFRDGASVRNASIFKIEQNNSISEVLGTSDEAGNWKWEVNAFTWNGSKYAYDAALSAKILKEQPKKIINGQPVF